MIVYERDIDGLHINTPLFKFYKMKKQIETCNRTETGLE